MTTALAVFIAAFVVALFAVPVAKRIALSLRIVDAPDKQRKLHGRIVPLTGGLTLLMTLPLVVGTAMAFDSQVRQSLAEDGLPLIGLGIAALILLIVGLADDRWGVRGRQKLMGQMISVACLLGCLYAHKPVDLFYGWLPIGFSFAFLMIWMIGSVNAVNLIDGADGLASTVGVIGATGLFFMTFNGEPTWNNVLAIALAGTLLGFLAFNFPPASTFLGDGGSLLIGLLLGGLAIHSSVKQAATIALCAPVAIVAIPFFDSFVAILRRRLTGRSIYTVDRGHLHHTLLERGLGPRRMLAVVAGLCLVSVSGGVAAIKFSNPWLAVLSVGLVISVLVIGRIFGYAEFRLLAHRILRVGRSLVVLPADRDAAHTQQFRLQGSRNWDYLWEAITEFAERHQLTEVRLDLNLPWLHEGYHAVWHRRANVERHEIWHTRIPLTANGRTYGRLEISAPLAETSVYALLGLLAELLESMESVITRLADTPQDPASGARAPSAAPAISSVRSEADSGSSSHAQISQSTS